MDIAPTIQIMTGSGGVVTIREADFDPKYQMRVPDAPAVPVTIADARLSTIADAVPPATRGKRGQFRPRES